MAFVNLTFWVWSERLTGVIDEVEFSMRAVSGGGRGGKNPEMTSKSYSAYTKSDEKAGQRGGTLPPGYYRVEKPSKYAGQISGKPISRLTPLEIEEPFEDDKVETPYGRDFKGRPFLIHGPGKLGSDGCIVIDKMHRTALLDAVEASHKRITLRVTTEDRDGILDSPKLPTGA